MRKRKTKYLSSGLPNVNIARSVFPLSYSHKTSFNMGDLVPMYIQEVVPGDSFKVKTSVVIRTSVPFIKPIMDNLFLDMFYFYVPSRIVWNRFTSMFGEDNPSEWTSPEEIIIPTLNSGKLNIGDLCEHLEMQPGDYNDQDGLSGEFNVLPVWSYWKVCNDFFRDENLQQPYYWDQDMASGSHLTFNSGTGLNAIYGKCAKINKLHDYFTSCLPAPQKGDSVSLPINGYVPVGALSAIHSTFNDVYLLNSGDTSGHLLGTKTDGSVGLLTSSDLNTLVNSSIVDAKFNPINLWANLNGNSIKEDGISAGGVGNINDLRFCYKLQRYKEKDARYGTRYNEYLFGHYGVMAPDNRLQRPEYLGGKRIPLHLTQVAQTSKTEQSSTQVDDILGSLGAYSLTGGDAGFNKGFVEHGYIIGLCAVRQIHTYQQGNDAMWRRKSKFDFYEPTFANLGEQPVMTSELYGVGKSGVDDVFGFNEAWSSYRYRGNRITGSLRSSANQGLDVWHLGDNYSSKPILGSEFIQETNIYLNRCLSADSTVIDNFIADFYHEVKAIRPMPVHSIPGLSDHH